MAPLLRFLCVFAALSILTGLAKATPAKKNGKYSPYPSKYSSSSHCPSPVTVTIPPITVTAPLVTITVTNKGSTKTITTTGTTTVTSTKTDCSSTSPGTPQPTFDCPKEGYNIRAGKTLEAINIATGQSTTLANNLGGPSGINAIGYNIKDNTFYARDIASGDILHIFSNGNTELVTHFTADLNSNLGDCDIDGHYWLSRAGVDWWEFDIDPTSPNYGKQIDSGTTSGVPDGLVVNDWAYIPVTGPYFYSLVVDNTTGGSAIVRWNSQTKQWSRFANYPDIVVDVWGAAWGENDGVLYGTDNTRGTIYRFDLVGDESPSVVSQGPTTGSTDAARCVLNILPEALFNN